MNILGVIKDGVVVLPPEVNLPNGTVVEMTVTDSPVGPSFAERYAAYIGMADDLPADLAEHLDHYVHGQPKP